MWNITRAGRLREGGPMLPRVIERRRACRGEPLSDLATPSRAMRDSAMQFVAEEATVRHRIDNEAGFAVPCSVPSGLQTMFRRGVFDVRGAPSDQARKEQQSSRT